MWVMTLVVLLDEQQLLLFPAAEVTSGVVVGTVPSQLGVLLLLLTGTLAAGWAEDTVWLAALVEGWELGRMVVCARAVVQESGTYGMEGSTMARVYEGREELMRIVSTPLTRLEGSPLQ